MAALKDGIALSFSKSAPKRWARIKPKSGPFGLQEVVSARRALQHPARQGA
ncbi:hypothetical protein RSAG8_07202, partial [Rhizoctonia solani AG-8 WAC10335]